jgi:hypothetical protein
MNSAGWLAPKGDARQSVSPGFLSSPEYEPEEIFDIAAKLMQKM